MKFLVVVLAFVSLAQLDQQRSSSADQIELKRQQQQARAISLIEQVGSEAELCDDRP